MLVAIFVSYLIGSVESDMKPFVVGGDNATGEQFPYAACLHIQCIDAVTKPASPWRCGGSIVNQDIVLTAAHCVTRELCGEVTILVTAGNAHRLKGTTRTVHRYSSHEDYKSDLSHDIALVRLKRPLDFGPTISRVAIMPQPPYKEPAEVAGWGRIDAVMLKLTNVLKYTHYTVLEKNACMDILEYIPEGTFCAGTTGHGYIYSGDSGSGLVVRGYIQIGISSYVKFGSINKVAVFTDVGYYYDWIKEYATDILCNK